MSQRMFKVALYTATEMDEIYSSLPCLQGVMAFHHLKRESQRFSTRIPMFFISIEWIGFRIAIEKCSLVMTRHVESNDHVAKEYLTKQGENETTHGVTNSKAAKGPNQKWDCHLSSCEGFMISELMGWIIGIG